MEKFRPEVELKGSGRMLDLFDNMIKGVFNITDDEYDYLCEHMTNVETDAYECITIGDDVTFLKKELQ